MNMKRGRKVFFVDVYCAQDCLTEGTVTVVVASRFKAKKAIRYIRNRCFRFHGSAIRSAWQGDLFFTGWTANRAMQRAAVIEAGSVKAWNRGRSPRFSSSYAL
jgi:hypothetical protein